MTTNDDSWLSRHVAVTGHRDRDSRFRSMNSRRVTTSSRRTPRRTSSLPIRWGSPCSWFSTRSRLRSESRSSCTTCSRSRSRRSLRSSVVRQTRRDSWRAGRADAFVRFRRSMPAPATDAATDRARQREVVTAFLAAARGGDFDALLAVLDPDIVLRADEAAVAMGSPTLVRGARLVAETFVGRARAARPMIVDGLAGLVWSSEGRPRVVFECRVSAGAIVEISMIADPDRLAELQLAPLD
jgi:hypothetical protein